ncbi:MAG: Nif3-like dinuclear metal center hexameric protein [Clostridia bacterium]|nr:Nif3-like dinuclear metal center hexameric protein [Clostridia bacterium]
MTSVREIYNYINELFPFDTQESWDNSGLLIGSMEAGVNKAVLSLDITREVAEEAGRLGAGLVISHHPIIFNAIKNIPAESAVYAVAKNNLSAICAHTNLDMGKGGVNDELFRRLGLINKSPLSVAKSVSFKQVAVYVPSDYAETVYAAMSSAGAGEYDGYGGCAFFGSGKGRFVPQGGAKPFIGSIGETETVDETRITMLCAPRKLKAVISAMLEAHPYEVPSYEITDNHAVADKTPMGLIGRLPGEMTAEQFAAHVRDSLGLDAVKLYGSRKTIGKVGICSGSGGSMLGLAIAAGCDALVTGDVKHDAAISAIDSGIVVIDAGHYGTENIIIEPLRKMLAERFPEVEFVKAESGRMKYRTI